MLARGADYDSGMDEPLPATDCSDAAAPVCLNCRYNLPAGGDICPECGLSRRDQQRAGARRRRRGQATVLGLLIVAAATGPIALSYLFGVASYGLPGSVFAILQIPLLPVIALLWGGLLDAIDPRGHWVGKLLLGVVLAAPTIALGVLVVNLVVIVIWGPQ